MKKLKKAFHLFIILIVSNSCVEPFDADFEADDFILAVDGVLSDQPTGNYVSLKTSVPSSSSSAYFVPLEDAFVEVFINGTERVSLSHRDDGLYDFPTGFMAEVAKTYQLKFTLANGEIYSSNEQQIKRKSTIEKVYQRFEERAIDMSGKAVPGHKVYLDTKDPLGKGDAYFWTWTLYENEEYCASCFAGVYRFDGAGVGSCIFDQLSNDLARTNDYRCDQKCWKIIYSNKLNAMNDAFVDGKSIEARLVAEVPYYSRDGSILEIKQHGISDQAYKFVELLIDQNQNSGSLVDTPSTALIGNMKNESNPKEAVGGFFMVSSISTYSHYVDRSEVSSNIVPIGFVNGRSRRLEGPDGEDPPLAPCDNTRYRTNSPPENWRF